MSCLRVRFTPLGMGSLLAFAFALLNWPAASCAQPTDPGLELKRGDHIAYIGNTMADRMQHHAWLETYIHAVHPEAHLTFRNLGFSGDEIDRRPRSENFGTPDEWLSKVKADVVFCFFGRNEALRSEAGLQDFRQALADMIDQMRSQQYNGESAPRLVVFSPIAHEDLESRHLPDGEADNQNLALYTQAMSEICERKRVRFVDLFSASQKLYAESTEPLTMNGVHLLERGNQAVAKVIMQQLFPNASLAMLENIDELRSAVLDKNYHWFSRYRVVDGYNVFGGRSRLAWFGQSNADVMQREMEIFDIKTANRDKQIWAIAAGEEYELKDDNLPQLLDVRTNKPGPLEGERWPYLGAEEAISEMTVHEGMEVNVFASEEEFPRLVNPVQMAVDTDSRLWVSVWPSYPHWNPTESRRDAILIFPDEDLDGKADECIVFADELNSITGFEFWGDGVLVAAPPELWFLKDTDGDHRADVKLRVLQGVSSADTHHSANALVIGPDGWLYWSRGIFNVANFETPTKTHRTTRSGVHRFNPRTFEVEFHFPIGPNPHGHAIDDWGYQFATDGTSGTGSYMNIGKGVGNKQWYKKRVRPVASIGMLSSSHFPEKLNGNFLICNTIGFLGVLQHEVQYNGADITAEEIDPIVVSTDQNFRPSDLEIGGDGALYIADWHNILIGHMQHNMRDPNRDHEHGRIYRVTYKGRELLEPAKMKGKPIQEVCEHFFAKETPTRYRARLELTSRTAEEIQEEVGEFASQLDPAVDNPERNEAQALLECLWVFEEQRLPNLELLAKVFQAAEPRIRAAAIRTLGHWAGKIEGWQPLLLTAARDESAVVRAEAVKAAVDFDGLDAAEAVFEAANRTLDPELETVLRYAKGQLDVDRRIKTAIANGESLSPAALTYALNNAALDDLLKLDRTSAVYEAILQRAEASTTQLSQALQGLAELREQPPITVLMELINEAQQREPNNLAGLGKLLAEQPPAELAPVREQIEALALEGPTPELKRVAYAAWVTVAGPDDAFLAATQSKDRLRDFLDAVPAVDISVRGDLYDKVVPLIDSLPTTLQAEQTSASFDQPGIEVDYFHPSAGNVARETLAGMQPKTSGIVPQIVMDVPQLQQRDRFALRFSGQLNVPESGEYTFFIASDDGSRLYLDGQERINNDGLHGMIEKSAKVQLAAGHHILLVTYFDNGGGDGLRVTWAGPGFKKQAIAPERLTVGSGETLHDLAIKALAAIPGREADKFVSLAEVVAAGKHQPAAIAALRTIATDDLPPQQVQRLIDNLLGYLSSMPARLRTSPTAKDAVELTKSLAGTMDESQGAKVLERLQNLDVRVIAIGTVPQRMNFDKEVIAIQSGQTVEFRFSNTDAMPHNFAITLPGSLVEIGELAEATANAPDAMARQYIPESDKILLASRLLQPTETQAMTFDAPLEPGVYPYVCTYPGHWRRMYGALYVVDDLDAYQANPQAYVAEYPLEIKDPMLEMSGKKRAWKVAELADDLKPFPSGRSFEVGRELFKVASCSGCHQLKGEGRNFGPDLAKLDKEKQSLDYLLESIIEPSKDVAEKYQSYTFVLITGKVITGMVVEETDDEIQLVIDPLAKDKPTIINKDDIEDQVKSPVSLMPAGLLDNLTREEILDLLVYVYTQGNEKHRAYTEHGHHH